jgi:hypothetical protein
MTIIQNTTNMYLGGSFSGGGGHNHGVMFPSKGGKRY